ncbi:MAG: lycopene cyclase domain-containing protein [Bacteroidetes bacterium]|nr:lycopene cyclase domain-containing protein [Bacteroidota bacterium]
MKSLYLIIDFVTILFPILLSFDKKVAYSKSWKYVFLSCFIVGIPFLIWDFFFTKNGVWGFNDDYLVGIKILNLPIEEILFFLLVPFSCLFIYACVKAYLTNYNFKKINVIFYWLIAFYILFILFFGYKGAYSFGVVVSSLITLLLIFWFGKKLTFLPIAFVISLIPFLIVNGVLTGAFTTEPVVWYNDEERTPFRIFTIPAEDILYSFTLIGLNILVFERLIKNAVLATHRS